MEKRPIPWEGAWKRAMHAEEGFLGLAIDPVDDPAEDCAWIGSLWPPRIIPFVLSPMLPLTLEPSRKLTRPPIGKTAFLPLADARCSHAGLSLRRTERGEQTRAPLYWRAGSIAGSVWSMRLDLGLAYFGGDSAYCRTPYSVVTWVAWRRSTTTVGLAC